MLVDLWSPVLMNRGIEKLRKRRIGENHVAWATKVANFAIAADYPSPRERGRGEVNERLFLFFMPRLLLLRRGEVGNDNVLQVCSGECRQK